MFLPYTGSGHYCYANSLAMVLGPDSPGPGVLEVLTGSPFGMQLLDGTTPFFDPAGWEGDIALDAACTAWGFACLRESGGTPEDAAGRLRAAGPGEPLLVGPVEMGLLTHAPGRGTPWEADHYVVVLGVEDDLVRFHDPAGYPFATLPVEQFVAAWRTDTLPYGTSFTSRRAFMRIRETTAAQAVREAIPTAISWLRGDHDHPVSAGTLANREAAERLADLCEDGMPDKMRSQLVDFAVAVGTRRLADAGACLAAAGADEASAITARQARLVGGLQYDLTAGRTGAAAESLRALAPTYGELADALASFAD
ncbi:hypothetical protein [Glycomyces sp. NPDC021274]|uniref:hypothetical protein n=1 Tax=Glycomyces sp. NPDC021274 TaxID=3155120 RepID=UPI0033CC4032